MSAMGESRMGGVALAIRHRSVSHPRSSNRTCPIKASGSPTGFTVRHTENHSLKGKRQVLRAIKARVRNKFNVSIAESDNHDMWQRAELGIAQVGSDRAFVDGALREVVNFIDSLGLVPLGEEQLEIINY